MSNNASLHAKVQEHWTDLTLLGCIDVEKLSPPKPLQRHPPPPAPQPLDARSRATHNKNLPAPAARPPTSLQVSLRRMHDVVVAHVIYSEIVEVSTSKQSWG